MGNYYGVESVATVWKIQDFSATQILRVTNFENVEVQKMPFLHYWGTDFCQFGKLQPSIRAKIHINQTSELLNMSKMADFENVNLPILISRKI